MFYLATKVEGVRSARVDLRSFSCKVWGAQSVQSEDNFEVLARAGWHAESAKEHHEDGFKLPFPWSCVSRCSPRWVVRPKSVFLTDEIWSIEMLIVPRLTGNMIIFRCKKWLLLGIWVDLTWRVTWLLQLQRLWDQFAQQTCYVYTGNEPKQAWALYKRQLNTWFRAGPRPWSQDEGTIYGTEMKTLLNFLVQWPTTDRFIKFHIWLSSWSRLLIYTLFIIERHFLLLFK